MNKQLEELKAAAIAALAATPGTRCDIHRCCYPRRRTGSAGSARDSRLNANWV